MPRDDDDEDKPKSKPRRDKNGNLIDKRGKVIPWDNTASWVNFVRSLFVFFIITIVFGLVGSNFIYLTTRGSELDIIFPTDDKFYNAKSYKTQKKGASNIVDCNETSTGTFSVFETNFPYNLIMFKETPTKEQLKTLTFVERMTNWFGKSVAGCFSKNRALLKGWLDIFNPDGIFGNHVFQIYIAAPLTLFVSLFALFSGFFCAFGAGFSTDAKVTIWGLILLWSWGIFGGLAWIIFFRLIATILFYPMSQNWKEVANIMACNVKPLVVLFGFFACGAAYDALDPIIAGIMGIVYVCLVGYTVFKYFTKQMGV